jgi:hypothetical protein
MKVLISSDVDGAPIHDLVECASYYVTEVVLCDGARPGPVERFATVRGIPLTRFSDKRAATRYAQALVAYWNGRASCTDQLVQLARGNMLLVYVRRAEET